MDAEHAFLVARHRSERLRIEELDEMARLHEPRGAGANRAAARLRDVVRALGHPEPLVDVEPEPFAPRGEHLVGERLARAHAVTQ